MVGGVNQSNEKRGETSFPCETHVRMKEIGANGPWPHASITTSKVQIWSAEPKNHTRYSKVIEAVYCKDRVIFSYNQQQTTMEISGI
jgi:hypothetical protein